MHRAILRRTHLSVNVIVSSNMNKPTSRHERNARQRRRLSSATTNRIFTADVYMATPAVFKTPIVNVTHSERRHIAAFLMRGICGRVLCAKLTMRRAKTRGEKDSANRQRQRRGKKQEETKARIALDVTKQMRVPR